MDVLCAIKTRYSVRKYHNVPVSQEQVIRILDAAVCAPSGKDRKPWKFKVILDSALLNIMAKKTVYSRWLKTAPCYVLVFLDKEKSYDRLKDIQSCGAVMQNILLAAHGLGLGGCWVGEILSYQEDIMAKLHISQSNYELMGLVAIGHANQLPHTKNECEISTFLL